MAMRSLIIHMPGSTKRRPNVDQLLRDLPRAQVVDAVDGRDPDQIADLPCHPGNLHRPHYPFALKPAEIGCFASHRKCWQLIVDMGWDHALIVEDDMEVSPRDLARSLTLISAHMTPKMFIRLPAKNREKNGVPLARAGDACLLLPRKIGLQTGGQVVGRAAARRLLAASAEIDRPIDTWLQMHWITGQPIHTLLPSGLREIADQMGGSTIQEKTRTSGKLMRELQRGWYRAQVRMRPQRPSRRPYFGAFVVRR